MSDRGVVEGTGFKARPRWQRRVFRFWRRTVLCRLPGKEGLAFIVPPREWSQEQADAAIRRGRELSAEHGWDQVRP